MAAESFPGNAHLESDIWRWLLFESGLSRRRAREIILQGVQSNALSLFWRAGPAILTQQLSLSPDEAARFQAAHDGWQALTARFDVERRQGLQTLRINEPGYPDPLTRFLPPERRPLLLFLRGEAALLEMPLLLPVAETPPAEDAAAWALDTLTELVAEGALPLLLAQAGFEARAARIFLEAEIPFVLVIPQGLAAYAPPPGLLRALDEDRALLLSPFPPEWRPPANRPNPMLSHAVDFARAAAHALLMLSSPAQQPATKQPCFRWSGLADGGPCADVYQDAETLFLRLAEATEPSFSDSVISALKPAAAEPNEPVDPVEILETLAQGGKIPPALADRLRKLPKSD